MTDRLPPFKSIEAFVMVAQRLSVTDAASALHLTVPAVSRRIQALEATLGVSLFQRMHRKLKLTQCGEIYIEKLAPAIQSLRQASASIRSMTRSNTLNVSVVPSFAANWLVPRLPRFYAQHSAVHVEFKTLTNDADFDLNHADLAIPLGYGNSPGLHTEHLLDVTVYPVCSPELVGSGGPLHALDDLVKLPLLASRQQPELWQHWLRMAGIAWPPKARLINFDSYHLLYESAAHGLGVAMGFDAIVHPYLDDGRLVRPFDFHYDFPKKFYVVCAAHDRERLPVRLFCKWLKAEAALWRERESMAVGPTDRTPRPMATKSAYEIRSKVAIKEEKADGGKQFSGTRVWRP